jgi:hypothetical protein
VKEVKEKGEKERQKDRHNIKEITKKDRKEMRKEERN